MIKLLKEKKEAKPKKKKTPYYLLKFDYMIGDSNGYTSETTKVSQDNPFVERFVKLLNKLQPVKGTWGLILDEKTINKATGEKQITKDDSEFLKLMLFEQQSKFEITDEEDDAGYVNELAEGVRSDTEYSFLVFEGVELTYVDEWGKHHKTKVE